MQPIFCFVFTAYRRSLTIFFSTLEAPITILLLLSGILISLYYIFEPRTDKDNDLYVNPATISDDDDHMTLTSFGGGQS
jgi:hypothetical protein